MQQQQQQNYCCKPLDFGVVCYTELLWQRLKLTSNNSENYLGCQPTKTRIHAIILNVFAEVLIDSSVLMRVLPFFSSA